MTLSRRRSALALAGVLFFAGMPAHALVLYGDSSGTFNTAAPGNAAPWEYVASFEGNKASAVYVGYGFLLTANHVDVLASLSLNGSVYSIDPSYAPLQIGGADLKLLRILGDPLLAPLELIRPQDSSTSKDATFIGWGAGKGAEVANQGWNWGDESTNTQRWGLNRTNAGYIYAAGSIPYLSTDFNRSGGFGNDEFSLALGDSGGGLFAKYGSTWRLIGIGAAVSTNGQAFYDTNPSDIGDTPTRSFFVPIQEYRSEILAAIPEPGTGVSILFGAVLFANWRTKGGRYFPRFL